jgi:hypothetical protein
MRWRGYTGTLRVLKPIATLLGPEFVRSSENIEIDITYACNLACYNCNRSVRQAPSPDHMSVKQIEKFIEESIEAGIKWKRVRLLGGEPTVHKQLFEIIDRLLAYKNKHSPSMRLVVSTNGHGDQVKRILSQLSDEVTILSTDKEGNDNPFYAFNLAPRDSKMHRYVDYSMGCHVPATCGTGLTPYGYYPCAVSGGIDRVLGLDIGRKSLPKEGDPMSEEMRRLCEWCGNFRRGGYAKWFETAEGDVQSSSWVEAYKRWREERPDLSRY